MSDNGFVGPIRPNEEAKKMLSRVFNKSEDSRPFITVTVEELLYEVSSEGRIIQILTDSDVNIDQVRTELLKYISKLPRKKSLRSEKEGERGAALKKPQRQEDALVTLVVENVVQNCFISKVSTFRLEDIVLSIAFLDPAEVSAAAILERGGLNREKLFRKVMPRIEEGQEVKTLSANTINKVFNSSKNKQPQKPTEASSLDFQKPTLIQNRRPGDNTVFIQSVEDIVKKMPSREWINETIWSRSDIENQIFKVLRCRRRSNVILVGESGVGKTTLMESVARILNDNVHGNEKLRGPVFSLDINSLFAGTAYRGDVEKKTKMIVQYLESLPPSVIFLDDFSVSSTQNQTSEVIGVLKDAMRKGCSRVIISVTPDRLRNLKEKDLSFSQKFQEVWIEEPSMKETKSILMSGIKNYEEFHNVSYKEEVLDKALIWADRYMKDRRFPEKIFQIIDESGVSVSMKGERVCDFKDIAETVSRMSRVDYETLTASDLSSVKALEKSLKETIVCQDEAISSIVDLVRLNKAGLGRGGRDKPIGCLLFAGPTGVGKTELSRQLAGFMGVSVARFDMSEYSEPHSISKLIGAPPGYIGHQNTGQLSEKISKNPRAVIIFDEFEKAHPQIHQILLQMMDYGFFTDGKGKEVDVRQTIIILTSNVGVFESDKQSIGFTSRNDDASKKERRIVAIENMIAPEFRNRLDKIVLFNSLDKDSLVKVVHKQLNCLNQQAKERNVSLLFTDKLIDMLTVRGYNPKMGARPLQRLIEKEVALNISDILLEAQEGGVIAVDFSQEKGVFSKLIEAD